MFAAAIALAIGRKLDSDGTYRAALEWAERKCQNAAVVDTLRLSAKEPPASYERQQGWVLLALQNAFYQLVNAPSLEEGVVRTVMAGGDTDTNGAIAGALLDAVYGREAVPRQWRQMVLSCRPAAGVAGVARPRPSAYWPTAAVELAERLLLA